ncbi:MAG: porin [Halorhodospira halophila]|uniref:porin n=1 Tax=Halorhodospira TaxID=85108 RepID=UPI001EE93A15|nr:MULTISPECIES: porin [Halorhodospira]MCC3750050.1 porin [Halorhodospira halophila]MCG5532639.1 porin [Halorhodospira sp. 9621]
MKRTTTAAVLAGAFSLGGIPWVAQSGSAEVDLYGQVHAGLNHFSYEDASDVTQFTDQGRTRLGVAGRQLLDGDWAAIGQLEWAVGPHLGEDNLSRRISYVGVDGPYGEVVVGAVHAAYKTLGGVRWDPLVTTELQQRRTGGMSGGSFGHNDFVDRAVQYVSPELAGWQLHAQIGTEDDNQDRTDDGDADPAMRQGDVILGADYTGLPDWQFIAAVMHLDEPFTDVDDVDDGDTNWKVGARWSPDAFSLAYQYESAEIIRGPAGAGRIDNLRGDDSNRVDGDDEDGIGVFTDSVDHHALIGTYEQGRNTWVLAFGHADADGDDEDVTSVTGALVHRPHADFRVYAGVQHQAFDDAIGRAGDAEDDYLTTYAIGARYDFGATF